MQHRIINYVQVEDNRIGKLSWDISYFPPSFVISAPYSSDLLSLKSPQPARCSSNLVRSNLAIRTDSVARSARSSTAPKLSVMKLEPIRSKYNHFEAVEHVTI